MHLLLRFPLSVVRHRKDVILPSVVATLLCTVLALIPTLIEQGVKGTVREDIYSRTGGASYEISFSPNGPGVEPLSDREYRDLLTTLGDSSAVVGIENVPTAVKADGSAEISVDSIRGSQAVHYGSLIKGHWTANENERVVSDSVARTLGIDVGDDFYMSGSDRPTKVTGIAVLKDQPDAAFVVGGRVQSLENAFNWYVLDLGSLPVSLQSLLDQNRISLFPVQIRVNERVTEKLRNEIPYVSLLATAFQWLLVFVIAASVLFVSLKLRDLRAVLCSIGASGLKAFCLTTILPIALVLMSVALGGLALSAAFYGGASSIGKTIGQYWTSETSLTAGSAWWIKVLLSAGALYLLVVFVVLISRSSFAQRSKLAIFSRTRLRTRFRTIVGILGILLTAAFVAAAVSFAQNKNLPFEVMASLQVFAGAVGIVIAVWWVGSLLCAKELRNASQLTALMALPIAIVCVLAAFLGGLTSMQITSYAQTMEKNSPSRTTYLTVDSVSTVGISQLERDFPEIMDQSVKFQIAKGAVATPSSGNEAEGFESFTIAGVDPSGLGKQFVNSISPEFAEAAGLQWIEGIDHYELDSPLQVSVLTPASDQKDPRGTMIGSVGTDAVDLRLGTAQLPGVVLARDDPFWERNGVVLSPTYRLFIPEFRTFPKDVQARFKQEALGLSTTALMQETAEVSRPRAELLALLISVATAVGLTALVILYAFVVRQRARSVLAVVHEYARNSRLKSIMLGVIWMAPIIVATWAETIVARFNFVVQRLPLRAQAEEYVVDLGLTWLIVPVVVTLAALLASVLLARAPRIAEE